jgi:DNA-binding XRE family transcriptional regulator
MAIHAKDAQTSRKPGEDRVLMSLEVEDLIANPVLTALVVLQDRVARLSKEDRDDVYGLLPDLLGGEPEAQQSAMQAISEILGNQPVTLVPLPPDNKLDDLAGWLTFFSTQLKAARKEAGLTQQELAAKSGLGQDHISRLEKGVFSPTEKTRKALALALGKPTKYFDPSAEDITETPPRQVRKQPRASTKPVKSKRK